MERKTTKPAANYNRLTIILAICGILLTVPLIAMQFTNEVSWTFMDFAVAAVLLFGTGLLCELVLRKVKQKSYRLVFCAILLIGLLLIWIELAVGIFGTPFAGS